MVCSFELVQRFCSRKRSHTRKNGGKRGSHSLCVGAGCGAHGAASRLRLAALSFSGARIGPVRQRERNAALRASSTTACPRPVRDPSGSPAETGPFSFLVVIEIDSQVLLLSRAAPLALITRCHADLRTRT